ncbi:MAG: hypothetical protein EPN97_10785 [Alphaproteobacteria bacterium]|nr:MAG: hypothetical protein EPN97_10785 [Alphaproteobacteria bacterium]
MSISRTHIIGFLLTLLTCLAARPAYADVGDAIDGAVYIACLAVTGMSVIALFFIRGGRREKIFGFIFCLLASALALPLIVIVTFTAGIYVGFALACLVLLLLVDFLNKSTARRAAEVEEELRRDAGNNDIPYVPEPALQKETREEEVKVDLLKAARAGKDDVLREAREEALNPAKPKAAPPSPVRIKRRADAIAAFAIICPALAGFIVQNNAPDGVVLPHFALVILPPVISFWWLPIKTYGLRIIYVGLLGVVYAAAVSLFLIGVYGWDDCPARRLVQNSECIPKQWENSARTYFREHPDAPYAVPSAGR